MPVWDRKCNPTAAHLQRRGRSHFRKSRPCNQLPQNSIQVRILSPRLFLNYAETSTYVTCRRSAVQSEIQRKSGSLPDSVKSRLHSMSKTSSLRVPSYRRHKPTDQAVVTINGRDIYLGKWNSTASKDEYGCILESLKFVREL